MAGISCTFMSPLTVPLCLSHLEPIEIRECAFLFLQMNCFMRAHGSYWNTSIWILVLSTRSRNCNPTIFICHIQFCTICLLLLHKNNDIHEMKEKEVCVRGRSIAHKCKWYVYDLIWGMLPVRVVHRGVACTCPLDLLRHRETVALPYTFSSILTQLKPIWKYVKVWNIVAFCFIHVTK
jgi:hypothetical protein